MSWQKKTAVFVRMLTTVAIVLLLLDESASFSLLPPPGAMLRPQISCNAPAGRIWPGKVGCGVGTALRNNVAYVAARQSGWTVGVALGAGAITLDESKRQTEKIQRCRSVRELAEFVTEYGGRFSHVNLNAAWMIMARLPPGDEDGVLAAALQPLTRKLLGKMVARQVANTLHSTATLHTAGRPRAGAEVVQQLASRSLEVLRSTLKVPFDAQNIANTMWALGKLDAKVSPELAKVMQVRAIKIAPTFTGQNVANLMWGLATSGVEVDPELAKAMQKRAIEIAPAFNEQQVANLMWGLATLEVEVNLELSKAMQDRAIEIAPAFKSQGISNLMWGLATLGVVTVPELAKVIQGQAIEIAPTFSAQNVANLMWALACFDTSYSPVSSLVAESMAVRLLSLREQLSVKDKSQMNQWLLFCDLHPEWRGQLPMSMQKVKEELGGDFRQAFALEAPSPSRLQVGESLVASLLFVGLAMILKTKSFN